MFWPMLLAAAAVAAAAAEVPALPDARSADVLKLQPAPDNQLTVPVTIEGQGPFRFTIDTGSQATVLSTLLADRLMLNDRKTALLVGMVSSESVETTSIQQFSLGTRIFPIRLAPLVEPANIGGGADGILGTDSLQGQRVLIDFKKQQIVVSNARQLGGDRGFEIVVKARQKLGQLIITHAYVNGVRTALLIDTGSPMSIGNPMLQRKLQSARQLGLATITDVNGTVVSGHTFEAQSLDIGRASVSHFPVVFADAPLFAVLGLTDEPAMVLGMNELKVFKRVAIDFEQRRILFDVPAGAERDTISWHMF
ncbi:MAG TPA: pepsin/retropepsin-like aspartic protease family protein [Croceibacterium sp.]|nr:pepsin/retropepsin-like aspartic protease family protein [Croceibacterium sp.]